MYSEWGHFLGNQHLTNLLTVSGGVIFLWTLLLKQTSMLL